MIALLCAALILSDLGLDRVADLLAARAPSRFTATVRRLASGWHDLHRVLAGRRLAVALFSIGLWLVHLVQVWMFTVALSLGVGFGTALAVFPIAVLAGQAPLTIAGIGARDVALVSLLAGHVTPEASAALGVLMTLRGLLPSIVALPVIGPYLSAGLEEAGRWRRG